MAPGIEARARSGRATPRGQQDGGIKSPAQTGKAFAHPTARARGSCAARAPRLGRARTPGVPITHRGAARPPEQGRCAGNHVHSAYRAGADVPSHITPALSPRALGLQTRCERAGRFFAAAPGRARPRRFARARAYAPGAGQRRSGGRPLRGSGGGPFKF